MVKGKVDVFIFAINNPGFKIWIDNLKGKRDVLPRQPLCDNIGHQQHNLEPLQPAIEK